MILEADLIGSPQRTLLDPADQSAPHVQVFANGIRRCHTQPYKVETETLRKRRFANRDKAIKLDLRQQLVIFRRTSYVPLQGGIGIYLELWQRSISEANTA